LPASAYSASFAFNRAQDKGASVLEPAMSSPITDNKMVVVYDGECPFCRNYVRLMSLRKAVGDGFKTDDVNDVLRTNGLPEVDAR
jgi:hypothetical protein